ncbi:monosaccharide-transporting ATPase (plasmid) [Alteromonas mediterranea 615]|uniref:Monosaccharide-transporting ATPase n=1 Tax=Alteromonas mediterranea 615 TaxID=1300253 RepID=S5AJ67_9ALTE|nr:monosaccharide-transporting ATPase [Alteromonas mediterranea 615]
MSECILQAENLSNTGAVKALNEFNIKFTTILIALWALMAREKHLLNILCGTIRQLGVFCIAVKILRAKSISSAAKDRAKFQKTNIFKDATCWKTVHCRPHGG